MADRVLVAGGTGFIGRHVTAALECGTDWDVVSFGRETVDLADCPDLCSMVGGVDYIINLAADADATGSLTQPQRIVSENVGITQTLLDYARTVRARRFIQVTSAEVFGTSATPHTEDAPNRPQTPYAASKAAADAVAMAYRESYDVPVVISATANVFGEWQPNGKLLPAVVSKLLAREPVTVIPGTRRFIHAADCASAWLWLLREDHDFTACNVAGDIRTDHHEFVAMIAETLGVDPTIEEMPATRPGHFGDITLSGDRLHDAGWTHPLGLRKGITRTVTALAAARSVTA